MNVTFLVGNGFDMNMGLKTTYKAFLEKYVVETDRDTELIRHFKSSILKETDKWSSAETAFGAATEQFKSEGYTAEDYCLCHEDFCVNLADYLLREEQRLNYTSLNGIISKEFSEGILKYKNGFREAERAAISTSEATFGGGLIFNFISFNYTDVLNLCFNAARSNSSLLGKRVLNGVTSANQLGKVLHVHGTVHRDMVLGVNDISQIAAPSLFDGYDAEYINQLIKQKTNEINEENSDKKAYDLLKQSDLIYIYGMSTGETDKLWWDRICILMKQKSNLHLIIHKHSAPEDGLIRRAFRLYVNEERQKFTAYSNIDADKKKEIEARIHIDKTNIFAGLSMLVDNPANLQILEEKLVTV